MKPKELDLNLIEMRQRAMQKMIDTMRSTLRRFDDIDALERLLHSEAAEEITQRVVTSTNGHARRETRPERLLPEPKTKKKKNAKRSNKAAVLEAALAIVNAHPDGVQTLDLLKRIRATTSVFDPKMTEGSAAAAVRDALSAEVKARRLRSTRKLGVNGGLTFYPLVEIDDGRKRKSASKGEGMTARLRTFIIDALLLEAGAAMSPREIKTLAVEAGFPEFEHGDRLSNHVNRVLRKLADEHVVNKKRTGKGLHDIEYVIVRPTVKVTKR